MVISAFYGVTDATFAFVGFWTGRRELHKTSFKKNLREIERLKHSIHDKTNKSVDLKQYDLRRMSEKFGR